MRDVIEAKGAADAERDAAFLNSLERHIIRGKAAQARRMARNDGELFDLALAFALADATHIGAVVDERVRYIAREFLGVVH